MSEQLRRLTDEELKSPTQTYIVGLERQLAEAQDRYDALAVALPEMTDRIANTEARLRASEAAQVEMRAALELFRLNSEHLRGCNIIHAWDGTEWARARRAECEGCPDGDGVAHWRCVPQCAAVRAALSSSGSGLLDAVKAAVDKATKHLQIEGVAHRMYEHSQMVTTKDVVFRPVQGCTRCKRIAQGAALSSSGSGLLDAVK